MHGEQEDCQCSAAQQKLTQQRVQKCPPKPAAMLCAQQDTVCGGVIVLRIVSRCEQLPAHRK